MSYPATEKLLLVPCMETFIHTYKLFNKKSKNIIQNNTMKDLSDGRGAAE